jgi:hypothetical protein
MKIRFLLIAMFIVGACSSNAAPTPQIIYVTPEPVVETTPVPTPTPVENTGFDEWLEFSLHGLSFVPTAYEYQVNLSEALSNLDYFEITSIATEYNTYLEKELRFLNNHTPHPCYEDYFEEYSSSWHYTNEAVKSINKFLDTFNEIHGERAFEYMETGTEHLDKANRMFETTSDRCMNG